jgi:L-asparaginase
VTRPHIRILATGGTIAGEADPACNGARYRAGVRPVTALLAAVPGLGEIASLDAQQILAIDSKDMTPDGGCTYCPPPARPWQIPRWMGW